MYCTRCGAELREGANFCNRCGAPAGGAKGTPLQDLQPGGMKPVRYYSFFESVRNFFVNYVNFTGRATRAEFWWAFLFQVIVGFIIGAVQAPFLMVSILSGHVDLFSYYMPSLIYSLAVLIPTLALYWRRLHDTGKSGLFFFLFLIPFAGIIIMIVFCCQDSDADNRFGPRKTE